MQGVSVLFVRTRTCLLIHALVTNSLGHFTILSIQLSFSTFVYPSICLAYLGQGARLIRDGDAVLSNLFYETIPGSHNGPLYWYVLQHDFNILSFSNNSLRVMFVFGILATVRYCTSFVARRKLTSAYSSSLHKLSLPLPSVLYSSLCRCTSFHRKPPSTLYL